MLWPSLCGGPEVSPGWPQGTLMGSAGRVKTDSVGGTTVPVGVWASRIERKKYI